MLELSTSSAQVFQAAVALLSEFAPKVRTQNFGAAIAVLMHRAGSQPMGLLPVVHAPYSGTAISTADLTRVCDTLYKKEPAFLPSPDQGPVYKPFKSFKPLSSKNQNNWRNSFDLQAGLSCDGPYTSEFLKNNDFLAEPRYDCQYRDSETGLCSSPTGLTNKDRRTCFNPDKRSGGTPAGPESSAMPVPKLLTRVAIDGSEGYWVIEPTREVLMDLLGDPKIRVPLYPFMAALYGGSAVLMTSRPWITREQFQQDLQLDNARFVTVFDPDPSLGLNKKFLDKCQEIAGAINIVDEDQELDDDDGTQATAGELTIVSDAASAPIPSIQPSLPLAPLTEAKAYAPGRDLAPFKLRSELEADPAERLRLLEKASRGHARALDDLARQLISRGLVPKEQEGGFDLYVECGNVGHLFEIKTWRLENLRAQVRSGVAQLYEYRWRNRQNLRPDTKLYIVLDRKPLDVELSWLWQYLVEDRSIIPCWIVENKLTTTQSFMEHISWLTETNTTSKS